MYAFLVLVGLALSLSVLLQAIDELVPFRAPVALTRTVAVALGTGLAWLLGYSAFSAFGQELRAEWMHPVMTGLALVAVGEFIRSAVSAIAHRSGSITETEPTSQTIRAA
jgi:hypothetical protein